MLEKNLEQLVKSMPKDEVWKTLSKLLSENEISKNDLMYKYLGVSTNSLSLEDNIVSQEDIIEELDKIFPDFYNLFLRYNNAHLHGTGYEDEGSLVKHRAIQLMSCLDSKDLLKQYLEKSPIRAQNTIMKHANFPFTFENDYFTRNEYERRPYVTAKDIDQQYLWIYASLFSFEHTSHSYESPIAHRLFELKISDTQEDRKEYLRLSLRESIRGLETLKNKDDFMRIFDKIDKSACNITSIDGEIEKLLNYYHSIDFNNKILSDSEQKIADAYENWQNNLVKFCQRVHRIRKLGRSQENQIESDANIISRGLKGLTIIHPTSEKPRNPSGLVEDVFHTGVYRTPFSKQMCELKQSDKSEDKKAYLRLCMQESAKAIRNIIWQPLYYFALTKLFNDEKAYDLHGKWDINAHETLPIQKEVFKNDLEFLEMQLQQLDSEYLSEEAINKIKDDYYMMQKKYADRIEEASIDRRTFVMSYVKGQNEFEPGYFTIDFAYLNFFLSIIMDDGILRSIDIPNWKSQNYHFFEKNYRSPSQSVTSDCLRVINSFLKDNSSYKKAGLLVHNEWVNQFKNIPFDSARKKRQELEKKGASGKYIERFDDAITFFTKKEIAQNANLIIERCSIGACIDAFSHLDNKTLKECILKDKTGTNARVMLMVLLMRQEADLEITLDAIQLQTNSTFVRSAVLRAKESLVEIRKRDELYTPCSFALVRNHPLKEELDQKAKIMEATGDSQPLVSCLAKIHRKKDEERVIAELPTLYPQRYCYQYSPDQKSLVLSSS